MATGTYAPWPFEQCFDNNGNPLNGGKLFTYLAGTSTPATTYSDVNLTTPNANPIVLSSAGFPSSGAIFLASGVSYKFVLQDSAGSTIATRDNVLAVPGTSNPTTDVRTCNLRLTLTSGTPVTTADVTAAVTVFIEPYQGNRIALYDGSTWNLRTVTASSFSVPASANQVYDVFCSDSSGTPTYETLAWTNDTTRATGLTTQDGVLVKSGAVTRRYLGTFRTTAVAGQTEDSAAKRYLWNYYNRDRRPIRISDATATWTYTTATLRQANANTANQADVVVGFAEATIELTLIVYGNNSTAGLFEFGFGEDSTTALATESIGNQNTGQVNSINIQGVARLTKKPAVGRHTYVWLERGSGAGTMTWAGTTGNVKSGIAGSIDA